MSDQPYKPNRQVNQITRAMDGLSSTPKTETVAIPAGAAGAIKDFQLKYRPILDAAGGDLGGDGGTSLALTSTAFTNEVPYGIPDAEMSNGDFYVNYVTGQGRGKKADASVSMSATYTILAPLATVEATVTPTITKVDDSNLSVVLAPLNANRKKLFIFNDSTEILYIAEAATSSLAAFTAKVYPNGEYLMDNPIYTGIVSGIWAADTATGAAMITESI